MAAPADPYSTPGWTVQFLYQQYGMLPMGAELEEAALEVEASAKQEGRELEMAVSGAASTTSRAAAAHDEPAHATRAGNSGAKKRTTAKDKD